MKYVKGSMSAALALAFVFALGAGTASATELDNASGMVATGSTISAEAESKVILHTSVGDIECSASTISATTTNTGGQAETVSANISVLTFTSCNATVSVLRVGGLVFHTQGSTANNNGTLTAEARSEITTEYLGFHCIWDLTGDIGTFTGSATTGSTATYDILAILPRTGGRSGAFCGEHAEMTASYKVTTPDTLNVT